MATPFSLALFCSVFALLHSAQSHSQFQSLGFIYNGFNSSNLIIEGDSIIESSGALRLTDKSKQVTGHAFHPKPIPMFNKIASSSSSSSSFPANCSSFSTYFVFKIVPPGAQHGGYGLAFTLSPSSSFAGGQGDHYLGILNSSNDGNSSNHIFMVEFDTVNGFKDVSDSKGNHVGININTMKSNVSEPASYFVNDTRNKEEVSLESGELIQAWIHYDGMEKMVKVTISPVSVKKPRKPLISERIDLSPVIKENMFAGFSAATGEKASSHYILGWSFELNGDAPPLDLSRLPVIRDGRKSSFSLKRHKIPIAGILAPAVLLCLGALFWVLRLRRRRQRSSRYEAMEDWELDCPHRFSYRDLHEATGGFRDREMIGAGGFGSVYRGVLPTTGAVVAVKKISNGSQQGMREFVAEIESLGRLRHKHLVNLRGWCKRKNDLLLVYEYIPNGSLSSLLFEPENGAVLCWEHRLNVVRGVAAGLLYLHEEWEQVVIHRDVKSSNVLIDGDMNGRLGDFGLARLYDHGKDSYTTNVVGTIGYVAPELAQTGQSSTSTDVFAFGILLLESACGRPAVVYQPRWGKVVLADWVFECAQIGRILDAADRRLKEAYSPVEMELVLGLGLLCSHPKPEARPTMRQVTMYLNGDEPLPFSEKLRSIGSRRIEETATRFLEVISSDLVSNSYRSSFTGGMSSGSFSSGR